MTLDLSQQYSQRKQRWNHLESSLSVLLIETQSKQKGSVVRRSVIILEFKYHPESERADRCAPREKRTLWHARVNNERRNVLTDAVRVVVVVAVASAVAAYDPAEHPSRSRPPFFGPWHWHYVRPCREHGITVNTGRKVFDLTHSLPCTCARARAYPVTPPCRPSTIPHSSYVARSLALAPAPAAAADRRRQWRGAGERSRTTVLPRIAEVASYDVPCAPILLSLFPLDASPGRCVL